MSSITSHVLILFVQSSEENRRPDFANTPKPLSEEMFPKRKRRKSHSSPMISVTTLQNKLPSSSDMRVQRMFSTTKKRRRSLSTPAHITGDDGNRTVTGENEQMDMELELTSKRFNELTFLVKKIYDMSVCTTSVTSTVIYKIHNEIFLVF